MKWWSNIWFEKADQWTYGPLGPEQVPDGLQHLPVEDKYINIFLRSMRIVNVRRGLSKFYGIAHCFITLPHRLNGNAQFHTMVSPMELKNIDAANLNRVVMMNRRLLGPVPYIGGDLDFELGLFSIKSADLAAPYLNLLESMAVEAGVSLVSASLPFVKPMLDGVKLLTGAQGTDCLEIGLSRTFDTVETGYFAIIAATKGTVDLKTLIVQDDFRLADNRGRSIDNFPYMVFSISATNERSDWSSIPELQSPYKNLQEKVREGVPQPAREAFAEFRRITLTSPDLIAEDAESLVEKVRMHMEKVLGATLTARVATTMPALSDIELYAK